MVTSPAKHILTRSRLLALCDTLESSRSSGITTLYLPPGLDESGIVSRIDSLSLNNDIAASITRISGRSLTGAVVIYAPPTMRLILPPFPITSATFSTLNLQPLRNLVTPDYVIGFVLVRLGSFAVGVARGENLITSKVGTGNVHGRHRQGGSSANRFRRHREKQIEYFITRLCACAREHLEPYVIEMNYLVYGGARTTIHLVKEQCEFLSRLPKPELPPHLDIPDPHRPVLEASIVQAWSSTLYEWL